MMDSAGPSTDRTPSEGGPALLGVTVCDVSETECRCVLEAGAPVSEGVVSAVRRSLDRDGRDADLASITPLARVVDPDSIDALFERSTREGVTVGFRYEGYQVTVRDGQTVVVRREPDRTEP